MKIGAWYKKSGECEFAVWAPFCDKLEVKIVYPQEQIKSLQKDEKGYWRGEIKGLDPKAQYFYVLDDELERSDPVSFFQPKSVHGSSAIFDHYHFRWSDQTWVPPSLEEMIIYEIHVGTFTPEGTFKAIIPRLKALLELGVNAIELMPVAQFPGERNWGYDGVYPFAVQNSYGGPDDLKELVNACHAQGMTVILDVVYNHLGPEGNYLNDFGPYFTEKYQTPWGKALNFDSAYNDEIRNFFIENALYWAEYFHIDGLRLDAVHAINDDSAKPFLRELKEITDAWAKKNKKKFYLIAESDLNDVKMIQPPEQGGFGIDAQWSDDFHHAAHTLLTGEEGGYYQDYGRLQHLKKALEESFVYDWKYSPFRKRRYGNDAKNISPNKFVVCLQNHDQVGNRILGERLAELVSFEGLKLAAGLLMFSPYIPLIFMGEEYGEKSRFNYFVSHSDKDLIDAVRKGRAEEFSSFNWEGSPPDPQDEKTFLNSKINWPDREKARHHVLLNYWRELIKLRKQTSALKNMNRENINAYCFEKEKVILFRRWSIEDHVAVVVNFSKNSQSVEIDLPEGAWVKMIDSLDEKWKGPGNSSAKVLDPHTIITLGPLSFAAYRRK